MDDDKSKTASKTTVALIGFALGVLTVIVILFMKDVEDTLNDVLEVAMTGRKGQEFAFNRTL